MQSISKVFHVIKANRHDHGNICVNNIGCIPFATHANFDNTNIYWVFCKGSKS